MKKLIALLLVTALLFTLAACGEKAEETDDGTTALSNTDDATTTTKPSVTTTTKTMTADEFLKTIEGIWVYENSVQEIVAGEYWYTFFECRSDKIYIGVVPGGVSTYTSITYTQLAEDTHSLTMVQQYPSEGEGPIRGETTTKTLITRSEGRMTLIGEDGMQFELIYGGKTLAEVDATLSK